MPMPFGTLAIVFGAWVLLFVLMVTVRGRRGEDE
jgi:hypothetical protein